MLNLASKVNIFYVTSGLTSAHFRFDFRLLERWERQLLRRFQLQLSEDQTVDSKVQQLQEKLETKVIELQKEIRQELGKF